MTKRWLVTINNKPFSALREWGVIYITLLESYSDKKAAFKRRRDIRSLLPNMLVQIDKKDNWEDSKYAFLPDGIHWNNWQLTEFYMTGDCKDKLRRIRKGLDNRVRG